MKRLSNLILTVALVAAIFLGCTAAFALTADDVVIEQWIGSIDAANEAIVVIDFGSKSYAFGYRFDGAKTGFQMLQDVVNDTDLLMETTYFPDWDSNRIDRLAYGTEDEAIDKENIYTSRWWQYWVATDGNDWSSPWDYGAEGRNLTDGSWDGWTWAPPYPEAGPAPDAPTVPEPGSLAALAGGLGLVFLRRRR